MRGKRTQMSHCCVLQALKGHGFPPAGRQNTILYIYFGSRGQHTWLVWRVLPLGCLGMAQLSGASFAYVHVRMCVCVYACVCQHDIIIFSPVSFSLAFHEFMRSSCNCFCINVQSRRRERARERPELYMFGRDCAFNADNSMIYESSLPN